MNLVVHVYVSVYFFKRLNMNNDNSLTHSLDTYLSWILECMSATEV